MDVVLTLLRIKNLALVEELEWQVSPGFVAITGETGAGKSIIIGALQLLLGERADKSLIRTGTDICTVEAIFSGDGLKKLNAQLAEAGIEPCENDLIIKRSFSVTSGTRQFINGSPTTEADSLLERNKSTVHQRLTYNVIHLETSWGRTCRSSWAARSPVVAFARDAIALTGFVRMR